MATRRHEVPMPPLEGEVPNEREAEGFVRKLSKKTPQSARSGCQLQLCIKHLYAINGYSC